MAIYSSNPAALDVELIRATFSEVVRRAAPLGHHYEISWVLFGAMSMPISLSASAIAALGTCENAIVALMSLNAANLGLLPGLDSSHWAARMIAADLQDEFWILCFEASRLGWLPWAGGMDHVSQDAGFSYLRTQGINFYNPL
jgi:hypothetical protein